MSQLGAKLRELRGMLSLMDVERGTGISRIEISRYEQGRYAPSPQNLVKLAAFFEVPYDILRMLYYEDLFEDPKERAIALEWARQHLLLDKS